MKTYIFRLSSYLIFTLFLSSCQKVINIDLNSASPQIVIEGNISDQTGPYSVKLSKTVNFSEPNIFPPVSGAVVRISDNAGNSETLQEKLPGIYTASTLQGTSGRTYTIEITDNGKNYAAVSTMPAPVEIDTLKFENSFFGNERFVIVGFKDLAGTENSYRIIQIVNGVPQKSIYIFNDYLEDGHYLSFPLFSQEGSLLSGDSVIVLLQNIDKGVYDYFRTLSQLSGDGGGQSASPANPTSNFTDGALGYFNAYSVRTKIIVIP